MSEKGKTKVKIVVAGNEFTVLTQEDESYTKELAQSVDKSIKEMCSSGRISVTAAAILTAVNFSDEIYKRDKEIELLGEQIKAYLDSANIQQMKYNDLKRENEKLRSDIEIYRKRLIKESPIADEPSPISQSVKFAGKNVAVSDSEEAAAEDEAPFFPKISN